MSRPYCAARLRTHSSTGPAPLRARRSANVSNSSGSSAATRSSRPSYTSSADGMRELRTRDFQITPSAASMFLMHAARARARGFTPSMCRPGTAASRMVHSSTPSLK